MLVQQYKIVSNGHYLAIWMPLSMAIGLPWGVVFKNIAPGLPIGMATGLAIAGFLNARVKHQGLVVSE